MSAPLDRRWAAYESVLGALKTVRRVVDGSRNPVANTVFELRDREEILGALENAREVVDDLFVLSFFAAFEDAMKAHLEMVIRTFDSHPTEPPELARNLSIHLAETVEGWRMDRIPSLFAPRVSEEDISKVGDVRVFRHEVAHGKLPASSVIPKQAYLILADFLRKAKS
ncbi:MAG: hypothetical protein HUU16_11610 [Candidatus Omnitrophica bacterium]|nr:hypothetical protein [Candidatus Omnitrophota bacterium]